VQCGARVVQFAAVAVPQPTAIERVADQGNGSPIVTAGQHKYRACNHHRQMRQHRPHSVVDLNCPLAGSSANRLSCMSKIWHEQPFARDAYELADTQFVASLKTYSTSSVIFGTGLVWLQILTGWILAFTSDLLAIVSLVIFIAAQQRAGIWVHEASHHNLFQSRRLNDLWSNVFFGSPIGMNVEAYRATHLSHHMYLSLDVDLDREVHDIDLSGRSFWIVLGKNLVGYYGFRVLFGKYVSFFFRKGAVQRQTNAGSLSVNNFVFLLMVLVWNGAFLFFCVLAGRWYFYFLLGAYPLFSIAQFIKIVRTVVEHQPVGHPVARIDEHPTVRTTLPSAIEASMIYCINFNYHLEHHLWPHVPFFQLPRLHSHLKDRGYYARRSDLLCCTGVAALWDLRGSRRGSQSSSLPAVAD
jgi:fatty acid desaturase